MSDERVFVQSATGVDLTLSIAGPGSRSYAFIIDWHIRLLLGCAWLLLAGFALSLSLNPRSPDALLSLLPAAVIYFLYHPIVEVALRGRTPGKRMAGVTLVNRSGGTPSTSALLIRNVFRLIDCLPAFYVVGLVCCFVTANRVRIGDMAAGTLLVLDDSAASKSLARLETLAAASRLPLDALELVDQVLERWPHLEIGKRRQIACQLLARLEPGRDVAQLSSLREDVLHARLTALLAGTEAAPGAAPWLTTRTCAPGLRHAPAPGAPRFNGWASCGGSGTQRWTKHWTPWRPTGDWRAIWQPPVDWRRAAAPPPVSNLCTRSCTR